MTPETAQTLAKTRDALDRIGAALISKEAVIRAAINLGISKTEAAQRTGLSRNTIARIVGHDH